MSKEGEIPEVKSKLRREGRKAKYHMPNIKPAVETPFLSPLEYGLLIEEALFSDGRIEVTTRDDLHCSEYCRHENCGAMVPVRTIELLTRAKSSKHIASLSSRWDSSSESVLDDGISKADVPEISLHTMLDHDSFIARGSIRGVWTIERRSLEGIFFGI